MEIILIALVIILYLIGGFLFIALSGQDLSTVKGLATTIFYPLTMWFIK